MKNNKTSFTLRLSESLLIAANEAAEQDHRKLNAYLRALIVKDCANRQISIEQPPPPAGSIRVNAVASPQYLRNEIDGLNESD